MIGTIWDTWTNAELAAVALGVGFAGALIGAAIVLMAMAYFGSRRV